MSKTDIGLFLNIYAYQFFIIVLAGSFNDGKYQQGCNFPAPIITHHLIKTIMKKAILFAVAAATISIGAKAQMTQFGVEAGMNLSSLHFKSTDPTTHSTTSGSSSMKIGFRAGVIADLGITENFSIQPGIFFSQMGGKDKSTGNKTGFSYIQVPINAVYSFDAGDGKLFVGAGPYVAYAAHAKVTGTNYSAKVAIGNDVTDELKPIDIGFDAIIGYKLSKGLYIKAAYNFGLVNIVPKSDDFSQKNMGFAFTLGYMLGSK